MRTIEITYRGQVHYRRPENSEDIASMVNIIHGQDNSLYDARYADTGEPYRPFICSECMSPMLNPCNCGNPPNKAIAGDAESAAR